VVRVLCAEHMEAAHKIWCKQRAFWSFLQNHGQICRWNAKLNGFASRLLP
jgi:hypothetical protein